MEGFTYHYKLREFKNLEEALDYHYTRPTEAHLLAIVYCGVVVGHIDLNKLCVEVCRNAGRKK